MTALFIEEKTHRLPCAARLERLRKLVGTFDAPAMARDAELCGWLLPAPMQSPEMPAMISGYFGSSNRFEEAIASFAVTYTDQNERDHQAFLEAIRDGKIQVYQEQ
jgi:Uncharacterized protein conserved in bacteria (DUF2252)